MEHVAFLPLQVSNPTSPYCHQSPPQSSATVSTNKHAPPHSSPAHTYYDASIMMIKMHFLIITQPPWARRRMKESEPCPWLGHGLSRGNILACSCSENTWIRMWPRLRAKNICFLIAREHFCLRSTS